MGMPESLCTCINASNNNTTYFIVDSNVSLSQLRDHINVFVGNEEYTISNENGEPITNDAQLKSLYVNSNFQVIINPIIKEEEQRFVIGETIRSILERVGVQLNENEQPNELIKRLPRPLPMFVGRRVKMLKKNPNKIAEAANRISIMFGVNEDALKAEMEACLNNIKEEEIEIPNPCRWRRNQPQEEYQGPEPKPKIPLFVPESIIEEKPEVPQEVKQPEVQVHRAYCDNCNNNVLIRGIRYKCLHCPDYDLCETCETKNQSENFHANDHVFAKIYKPTGAFVFPGMFAFHNRRRQWPCHGRKFERIESLEKAVAALQDQVKQLQGG